MSSFARCLIEVNSKADIVDVVIIGIPSLSGDDFIKETIRVEYEWRPPRCDICKKFCHVHDHCSKKVVSPPIVTTSNVVTPTVEKTNDGFQTVGKKKKRKGKSMSTNGGQFVGPSVKHNVRYEPKATTKEDDEEDVQNVYDESANLLQNTKAGGSLSFTATAMMGIHDFICLPEWTDLTLKDLIANNTSVKVVAKAEASQKQKASIFGVASSHVAKLTRYVMAQSFGSTTRPNLFADDSGAKNDNEDDACFEIPIIALIHSATVIPSSRSQGKGSADSVAEDSSTQGKGIMIDAVVASPVVASRPRPSSGLAFSFREISEDAIHRDFFPFSLGLYYATYPEGDVAGNYEFSHEEWDASRQPTLMILTKEVLRILLFARLCWTNFQHRRKWSRLKVFGLRKQVAGLNDKLSSSDATFAKSKAKGKEKKKKIKSLSKSLDNLQAEVAGLSTDLNRVTILEVDKDDEILHLKATPPEFASFLRGQFQCLVWKFLAFDEFSRVQAELLSLKASAGFEHFKHAIEPLSVILQLKPEKLARPANVPASKDANVSSPLVKESIVTPAFEPLDFPSNVIPASSTAALEPNEELLMFLSYSLVYVLLMTLLFIGVVCSERGDRRDSSFGLSPKFSCFDFAIPYIVHVRGRRQLVMLVVSHNPCAWSGASKFKRIAYEYIFSSGPSRIIPTPEPSLHASLLKYNLHALGVRASSASFVQLGPSAISKFWRTFRMGSMSFANFGFPEYFSGLTRASLAKHTTAPVAEGALILLPTPDEDAAAQPDPRLARRSQGPSKGKARISFVVDSEPIQPSKKSKLRKRVHEAVSSNPEVEQIEGLGDAHISSFYVELKDSLERSGGIPVRVIFAPLSHLVALMESLGFEDVRRCSDPLDTLARSALSRDAEYDQILEDDFVSASRGEEIDMTFFPIAPGLNVIHIRLMVTLLLHTLNNNGMVLICRRIISCARIFSEIRMFVGKLWIVLLPLLSLGEHEKLKKVQGDCSVLNHQNRELHSQNDASFKEVKMLQSQLANAINFTTKLSDELDQTDVKLADYALVVRDLQNELPLERSKSQEYKDVAKGLRTEVTYFVGSAVECLVRRLLSSDEFHASLAHVSTLAVVSGAEFNKSLDALPSTPFLFLHKVVAAASGALSEVTQILPDKLVRPIAPVSTMPHVVNEALNQAHVDHASDNLPYRAYLLGREDFVLPPSLWYFILPRASGKGPTMSIPYFWNGQANVTEIVSIFGNIGMVAYTWHESQLVMFPCVFPKLHTLPVTGLCIVVVVLVSFGRIPFSMYSYIGVIQVHAASSTIVFTLAMSIEHSLSPSINTPFVSPLHCTVASLIWPSAFLFSSL
nr:zinc knuckle CX2CX4HX4C [Tanacetum cinerariifolium]